MEAKLGLDTLNTASSSEFAAALAGIYEHSPWIPERAAALRPFATVAALRQALHGVVRAASVDEQLGLLRAHPELAGKAAIASGLTAESAGEQAKAGLHRCSPEEFATLQRLNGDYHAKFGFPFILAVKGPDGQGLTRQQIIATLARRCASTVAEELAECLRQVGRIAELRLNDLLDVQHRFGPQMMARAARLAQWSESNQGLTCTYLSPAHRSVAAQLSDWMREAGMETQTDMLGNVVGRYHGGSAGAKTLMLGSHYDTVRNGGMFDGRAGLLLSIAVVGQLHAAGERLPFDLEVVGFAEEEGVRFQSTLLGSTALAGCFDMAALERRGADGVSLREVLSGMREAKDEDGDWARDGNMGRDGDADRAGDSPAARGTLEQAITTLARRPDDVLGFVELHIEQGPVLLERDAPLGIVTAVAGASRYQIELTGLASHAGATPMDMRRDAAAAAAEIVLLVERRCAQEPGLVGTVGQLAVPDGSANVVPGRCRLSLDIRATDDPTREQALQDVVADMGEICQRRGIECALTQTHCAPATPCAPWLMRQLAAAVGRAGLPVVELPSGAGHDAMAMAKLTDSAMLFIRCGNGGISHNPLETMTADDAELAGQVLLDFLRNFAPSAQAATS